MPVNVPEFTWFSAVLVGLYGFSSWIVINGLWVELPLLVNVLPEGWNLPAYLAVLIQVANLSPVIYVLLTKFLRSKGNGYFSRCLQPPERLANYLIIAIGVLSCILLANYWQSTINIPAWSTKSYSIGLLILALSAAIVDCTSTVTFVTYLNGMPQSYIGALTFGEAFSDLVPSSLSLIQGVGSDPICINKTINGSSQIMAQYTLPRFSVSVFCYLLASGLFITFVAYMMLDLLPNGLGRFVHNYYREMYHLNSDTNKDEISSQKFQLDNPIDFSVETRDKTNSPMQIFLSVIIIIYISVLNYGFLPAIQSYSCASYSSLTYHLAVTLSAFVGALLSIVTTIYVNRSSFIRAKQGDQQSSSGLGTTIEGRMFKRGGLHWSSPQCHWLCLTGLTVIPAAYVIYLAAASPNPPHLNGFGPILAVLAWILLRALFTCLRTWIWMNLSSSGHRAMLIRLVGLASQTGSVIGAILSFVLVVHLNVFKVKQFCQ